jgi:hypothetical protein
VRGLLCIEFSIYQMLSAPVVMAAVQIKPEWQGKVTDRQLRDHVRSRLAAFKIPVYVALLLTTPHNLLVKKHLQSVAVFIVFTVDYIRNTGSLWLS